MWLLEALHDRYPWLGPGIVVAVLVTGVLSALGCASIPTEQGPMRPGLRVVARCPTKDGVVVLAYPASRTFVGGLTLAATAVGAAIGTAVAPGAGSAVGAGVGAVVGAVVEAVQVLWSGQDPVPACPGSSPSP